MAWQDYWELIGAGIDAGVMLLLYRIYQDKVKEANLVKETSLYAVGPELQRALEGAPENILPYVCVEGVTRAIGKPLRSHYHDNEEGVIQHLLYVEHKAKRTQGYWSDIKRFIKNQIVARPFKLVNPVDGDDSFFLHVTDPLDADYIRAGMTSTHDEYIPSKDDLLSRGIDRLFGEITKGFQETETMLGIGVPLLGIGRVVATGDKVTLEPPDSGHRYILTTLSKGQIIKDMQSSASWAKAALWVFGILGTGLISYWLYKMSRIWIERLKMSRFYDEIRRQREEHRTREENGESQDDDQSNTCVVCLENAREVVVLDCGHICLCAECSVALPEPKKCPVCRADVVRFISTYNP